MPPPLSADQVKREYTRERLLQLALAEGLRRCGREYRVRPCPACGAESDRVVKLDTAPEGHGLWACQSCGVGGDAITLLEHTQRLTVPEAVAKLAEGLHLLPAPEPPRAGTAPIDVLALWRGLATSDPAGQAYLESRGLGAAAAQGLLRFATGQSGYPWLDARAREGFRVAMALRDASGKLHSLQLRWSRADQEPPLRPHSDKRWSSRIQLAGVKGQALLGAVSAARTAPLVYVAEGMADTLAVQLALATTDPAAGAAKSSSPAVAVVGAPGQDQLRHVPEYLGDPAAGRAVVLCPQNDQPRPAVPGAAPPPPTSAERFCELASQLEADGWTVHQLHTPALHADPADWLRAVGLEAFRAGVQAAVPPAQDPQLDLLEGPTKPKRLTKSYASLLQILREDQRVLRGRLAWDEMLCCPTIDGRELEDADTGKLRERIELLYSAGKRKMQFASGDIEQAIIQIASDQRRHPVREHLESLTWDGIERYAGVVGDVLGAEMSELNLVLLRKWFISAVARPLSPGCKMDTVLVLQGAQGLGKSTFFETLASPRWFADEKLNIEDTDHLLLMQRTWIYEWAELATLKRADLETVRAFITRRENRFRAPYGRRVIVRPRHTVIVGTANPKEILTDPHGNRRFWPLGVSRVDLALLRSWRDQLWAEAVVRYRRGEQWHLTDQEDAQLREAQEEYEERHPWEDLVMGWLAANDKAEYPHQTTTDNILERAVKKPPGQWTRADQMAIATILRRHGWSRPEYRRRDLDGHRPRVWLRPDPASGLTSQASLAQRPNLGPTSFAEVGPQKTIQVSDV